MTLTDTHTTTTDPAPATTSGFSSGPRPRARGDLDGQPSERLEVGVGNAGTVRTVDGCT